MKQSESTPEFYNPYYKFGHKMNNMTIGRKYKQTYNDNPPPGYYDPNDSLTVPRSPSTKINTETMVEVTQFAMPDVNSSFGGFRLVQTELIQEPVLPRGGSPLRMKSPPRAPIDAPPRGGSPLRIKSPPKPHSIPRRLTEIINRREMQTKNVYAMRTSK